jgi:CRP-like cAMP-binding protein
MSDNLLNGFIEPFKEKFVKKRQYIIQPDFTARHRNFVVKGALRGFIICKDGHDHTIQFAIESWWISDYNSYIYQKPATMFVTAVEDSLVLQLDYEEECRLKEKHHLYERFFRIMGEKGTAFMQKRIITNLTQDAESRYNHFMDKYGKIALRMPQYALASYLGMTTEYLSKLRNNKVGRKS